MPGAHPEGDYKLNILGVFRGGERYLFVFDDSSFEQASVTMRRFANNPDLSFSWHDATILGERLREMRAKLPELGGNREDGKGPDNGPIDDTTEK